MRPFPSIRILPGGKCPYQDFEVQGKGPIFKIIEVILDAFGNAGVAAQAIDLRPAGHARLGGMPPDIAVNVCLLYTSDAADE